MFKDGIALSVTFAVAVGFAAVAAFMQIHRESHRSGLATPTRFHAFIKSFITGFSFASELFLMAGLMGEKTAMATTMLLFRLLHLFGCVFLMTVFFGPERISVELGANATRRELNKDFCIEKAMPVGVIILLCCCDVSMVQFLPFKESTFFQKSKGYATMFLMKVCLSIDCLQSSVTAICQIVYLGESSNTSGPTTTSQAKFMFAANIMISLVGVVMGLILLIMKQSVLENSSSSSSDEQHSGEKEDKNDEASEISADVELAMVYSKSISSILDNESGGIVTCDNPMHTAATIELNSAITTPPLEGHQVQYSVDSAGPPHSPPSSSAAVATATTALKEENNDPRALALEIQGLQGQIEGLQRRLSLALADDPFCPPGDTIPMTPTIDTQ
jgi:hypothetical protein